MSFANEPDPSTGPSPDPSPEPHGRDAEPWPAQLSPLFEKAITVTYVSQTKDGNPVSSPLTPYVGQGGATLDVSTGLTYPSKAERARRNPKVCLLYSDMVGSGLMAAPIALVRGWAAVRDSNLQANADRYIQLSQAKLPDSTKGQPKILLRRFRWYFSRIWIEITPAHILWWEGGDLDKEPIEWRAPDTLEIPESDAKPLGMAPPPWLEPPLSWQEHADYAISNLSHRDLSYVDRDGFPICVPAREVESIAEGFRLQLPRGIRLPDGGGACMTFHDHPEVFTGQENRTFIGTISATTGGSILFSVERALADWSLPGNRLKMAAGFLSKGRRLSPRLKREAERRGQQVPEVRFPGEY